MSGGIKSDEAILRMRAWRKIRKALKKDGWEKEKINRIIRLLRMKPTKEERRRWEKIGLIKEGVIVLSKDEEKRVDTLTLTLWEMAVEGLLEMKIQM